RLRAERRGRAPGARGQGPPRGGQLPRVRDLDLGVSPMTTQHPPVENWATDFDHTDPQWVADPYPIWEELRSACPVAHSERYGGTWRPARHEDGSAIAHDTEDFASRPGGGMRVRRGRDDPPAR